MYGLKNGKMNQKKHHDTAQTYLCTLFAYLSTEYAGFLIQSKTQKCTHNPTKAGTG